MYSEYIQNAVDACVNDTRILSFSVCDVVVEKYIQKCCPNFLLKYIKGVRKINGKQFSFFFKNYMGWCYMKHNFLILLFQQVSRAGFQRSGSSSGASQQVQSGSFQTTTTTSSSYYDQQQQQQQQHQYSVLNGPTATHTTFSQQPAVSTGSVSSKG